MTDCINEDLLGWETHSFLPLFVRNLEKQMEIWEVKVRTGSAEANINIIHKAVAYTVALMLQPLSAS